MKNNIKLLYVLIFTILLSACTSRFDEFNIENNNSTNAEAMQIFTNACYSAISNQLGTGTNANFDYLECWSQHIAKAQYRQSDQYRCNIDDINNIFNKSYQNEIKDFNIIIEKAIKMQASVDADSVNLGKNLEAVSRIMRTWSYAFLTDLFGDIPYSQAAIADPLNLTPEYDSQEDIYNDLINELTLANTLLTTGNIGNEDIIYSGDILSWKKFANSFNLRLLNRCSLVLSSADAKIATILNDNVAYPIFESNENDAELDFTSLNPKNNPLYEKLRSRTDYVMSKTIIDWLNERNDPRLSIYAMTVSDTIYVGQPNGAKSDPDIHSVSQIGTKFTSNPDAPLYLMQYSEVEFIKAEYYVRNNDTKAKEAYEAGITASINKHGGELNDYLTEDKVIYTEVNKSQRIAEQKWVALFTQGAETYTEVRRSGYPSVIYENKIEDSAFPKQGLPDRFPYPSSEWLTNEQNLQTAIIRAKTPIIDEIFGGEMWWDID